MSGKFQYEVKDEGTRMVLSFSGMIDEDVDFSQIPIVAKESYLFNFDGVKAINSCGIREWVKFTEQFAPQVTLVYENCTQIIIEQINMVAGFFRKGSKVESFYAPYFCEACDDERKILVNGSLIEGTSAPEMKCPECSGEMEFDALEDQYFRFLKMTA